METGAKLFRDSPYQAGENQPAKALEAYLVMTQAGGHLLARLEGRGLITAEFEALPADEQQTLFAEMQRDMVEEMKKASITQPPA